MVNILFYKCNLPPEAFKEILPKIWRAQLNSMTGNFIVLIMKKHKCINIYACVNVDIDIQQSLS